MNKLKQEGNKYFIERKKLCGNMRDFYSLIKSF